MGSTFNKKCQQILERQTNEILSLQKEADQFYTGQSSGGSDLAAVAFPFLQKAGNSLRTSFGSLDTFIKKVTKLVAKINQRAEYVGRLPLNQIQPRVQLQTDIEDIKEKIEKWNGYVNRAFQTKKNKSYKIRLNLLLTDLNNAESKATYRTKSRPKSPKI